MAKKVAKEVASVTFVTTLDAARTIASGLVSGYGASKRFMESLYAGQLALKVAYDAIAFKAGDSETAGKPRNQSDQAFIIQALRVAGRRLVDQHNSNEAVLEAAAKKEGKEYTADLKGFQNIKLDHDNLTLILEPAKARNRNTKVNTPSAGGQAVAAIPVDAATLRTQVADTQKFMGATLKGTDLSGQKLVLRAYLGELKAHGVSFDDIREAWDSLTVKMTTAKVDETAPIKDENPAVEPLKLAA